MQNKKNKKGWEPLRHWKTFPAPFLVGTPVKNSCVRPCIIVDAGKKTHRKYQVHECKRVIKLHTCVRTYNLYYIKHYYMRPHMAYYVCNIHRLFLTTDLYGLSISFRRSRLFTHSTHTYMTPCVS